MITKEEVQKYISILKEVPDKVGLTPTDGYNTRFVGPWGTFVFVYLPVDIADEIKAMLDAADEKGVKKCRKVSHEHHDNYRFFCTLSKGHKGLCVGGSDDNEICAIFEPDEETDSSDYLAHKLAKLMTHMIVDSAIDKADCDD